MAATSQIDGTLSLQEIEVESGPAAKAQAMPGSIMAKSTYRSATSVTKSSIGTCGESAQRRLIC